MTGPEHYRKAEELARTAARWPTADDAPVLAQLATAHALLANAAATAFQPSTYGVNRAEWKAWEAAAFTKDEDQ